MFKVELAATTQTIHVIPVTIKTIYSGELN